MSQLRPSGLKAPTKILKHGSSALKATTAVAAAPADKSASVDKAPSAPPSKAPEEFVDDFHIGERVWVNGSKPGFIQFLGETQFAPGQWAGIILDEPIGKNDGSVAGVRYFQCEPLKGIFTWPSKLSRACQAHDEANGLPAASAARATSPPSGGPATCLPTPPKASQPAVRDSPPTPYKMASKSISKLSEAGSVKKGERELRNGDHVLVGGTKAGVVRFLGETDFAKGESCAVELDEPHGKNDGAVAGKRYFQGQNKYGLFAPVQKVTKIGFPSTTPAKAKAKAATVRRSLVTVPAGMKRSPSVSSVSSMSSVASSVSSKPSRTGLVVTVSEKSHIMELERDLALRTQEVAELRKRLEDSKPAGEADSSLSLLQEVSALQGALEAAHAYHHREVASLQEQLRAREEAHQREVKALQATAEKLSKDSEALRGQLAHANKENADVIALWKSKLATAIASHQQAMAELKASVRRGMGAKLTDVTQLKVQMQKTRLECQQKVETLRAWQDAEQAAHARELEMLRAKLMKVVQEKESCLEAVRSKLDLTEDQHLEEMEEVLDKLQEAETKKENFSEVLKAAASVQSSLQETVHKLHQKEEQFDVLSIELDRLRRTLTVMEIQFKERGKREEQLVKAKAKLEAEIADIVKMSGDHSSQLTLMNNELQKRDRCVEELQLQLMKANEQSSLLKDSIWGISMKTEETEQEMRRVYQEELKQMYRRMTNMEEQMVASRKQCQVLQATHEQASAESKARHDEALQGLRQQLLQAEERLHDAQVENGNLRQELAELKKQADKAQALVQEVEMLTAEKALALEKQAGLDSLCVTLTQERNGLAQSHRALQQERDALRQEQEKLSASLEAAEQVQQLLSGEADCLCARLEEASQAARQAELEAQQAQAVNTSLMQLLEQLQATREVSDAECAQLLREKETLSLAERRLEAECKELLSENGLLAENLRQGSEEAARVKAALTEQLGLLRADKELESQNAAMLRRQLDGVLADKAALEAQHAHLLADREETRQALGDLLQKLDDEAAGRKAAEHEKMQLEKELAALRQELQKQQEQSQGLAASRGELSLALKEAQETNRSLEEAHASTLQGKEALDAELQRQEEETRAVQQSLEREREARAQEASELQGRAELLEQETEELRAEHRELLQEKTKSDQRVTQILREKEHLSADTALLAANIEALKRDFAALSNSKLQLQELHSCLSQILADVRHTHEAALSERAQAMKESRNLRQEAAQTEEDAMQVMERLSKEKTETLASLENSRNTTEKLQSELNTLKSVEEQNKKKKKKNKKKKKKGRAEQVKRTNSRE